MWDGFSFIESEVKNVPKQEPKEQVQQIPLSEIRPFKNHPFKVVDDELMQQTIDSIMQVGILKPCRRTRAGDHRAGTGANKSPG